MNSSEPKRSSFPSLPIINNPQVPRGASGRSMEPCFTWGSSDDRPVILVGWFGYRAWSLRDIWAKIYVLTMPVNPKRGGFRPLSALATILGSSKNSCGT